MIPDEDFQNFANYVEMMKQEFDLAVMGLSNFPNYNKVMEFMRNYRKNPEEMQKIQVLAINYLDGVETNGFDFALLTRKNKGVSLSPPNSGDRRAFMQNIESKV